MTHCTGKAIRFSNRRRRKVEADFQGGSITGNGGMMLVSEQDRRLGLTTQIARLLDDPRRQASCRHSQLNLLRQQLHALCLGHEDPDDHDELRHDAALQTAADRDTPLACASTLCRFESQALLDEARSRHEGSGEQQRLFGEIAYQAKTWRRPRRVLVKAEHLVGGANPHHVVTNLEGDPQELYDQVYCARGEMENRIREQQPDLFAVVAEPVPHADRRTGICAAGADPPPRAVRHPAGPGACRHDPSEAAAHRCGDRAQYPPGRLHAVRELPVPEPVPPRGTASGARIAASFRPDARSRNSMRTAPARTSGNRRHGRPGGRLPAL